MALTDEKIVREGSRISGYETERVTVLERERKVEEWISRYSMAGGAVMKGLAGVTAIVLTLVGLTGYNPVTLLSIAAVVLGGAFLLESAALWSRFMGIIHELRDRAVIGLAVWFGAFAAFVTGGGALTLGLLALLDRSPMLFNPIAVLVLGGGLVLSSTATLGLLESRGLTERERARFLTAGIISAVSSLQTLGGLTGVVLGILALAGVLPVTLTLIAMLVIGTTVFIGGSMTMCRQAIR